MQHLNVARRTVSCLAILASLVLPAAGRAQGIFGSAGKAPEPAAQQDTVQATARAIPLAEIPLRANEALARLQTIETQLSADPDLALIEAQLPAEMLAVSRAHDGLRRIVMENLSLRELWNLTSIWRAHERRLAEWDADFEAELRELSTVAERGRRIRDNWRLTADGVADEEEVAPVLVEQVDRVLTATGALQGIIRDRLDYLLGVKSVLDEGLEGVRQVLRDLDAARASVRGRMFARGAPPLWDVGALADEASSESADRVWSAEREAMATFAANNTESMLMCMVLFLVFALIAVRMRALMGSALDPSDESLRGAADTLRRPVSAAFLLTILVANFVWLDAPFSLWQLVSLAAVVPVYRLLPRSRNPVINETVRALLLLFVVLGVADVLLPPSLAYRLASLLVALGLAGAAGWLLRSADPDDMRQTGWGVVVWRGLQVGLLAGIVSALCNVAGLMLFAETLLAGVLYSAYLGLAIVIGYRFLAGLVRLLPLTRIGRASHIVRDYGDIVTRRTIKVLKVIALVTWVYLSLEAFEVVDPIGDWGVGLLTGEIHIGAIEVSLIKIISFAAVVLGAIWLARFVAFALDVEILPRFKLKRGVSNAISTVVQWGILGAGLLIAGGALGLQAGQLAIVFGALSVGIGFGLQNIVSNFVSGLILIFEQPVKVGDKVEITSLALTGEVRRIGIRASVVRTFDGAEVIVPNGNLISSEVVNWTLSDQRRRVRIDVGVAYGTDPHRVIEILTAAAVAHREVLRYPEPVVMFMEFGESSLNFRLLFWTATFDDFFRVRSELHIDVHDALDEAGITIPFPQRDLHLKGVDRFPPAEGPAVELPASGEPVSADPEGSGPGSKGTR